MTTTAVKIFPSVDALCQHLKIQAPLESHSDSKWIEIPEEDSGIVSGKGSFAHPFLFFLGDQAAEFEEHENMFCFSRTTTGIPFNASPPKTMGVPSHLNQQCCTLINADAWVDFRFCVPSQESHLAQIIDFAKSPSEAASMARTLGKSQRECRHESEDIKQQLWIALRKDRGVL